MRNSQDQAAKTAEDTAQADAEPQTAETATVDQPRKNPLKECKDCERWFEIREHARVSVLLKDAVEKYEEKLNDKGFKPSLAEFLKLLQLEKEIEDETQGKETHVLWVETQTESEPLK